MSDCDLKSHIVDSRFFSQGYATDEARQIFCDLRRMQRWLEVETALANSQAELDIIPSEAAEEISKSAQIGNLDIDAIKQELATTNHSLIPLLSAWQEKTANDHGQYIHYGATTQDIQDTAQSLELRDIFSILERDLTAIIQIMTGLAAEHRDLVMIGRTHGQPALPTTLGLKIAGWLDEAIRNLHRLQTCKKTILVSQLFGGVGTMSALSPKADKLIQLFSKKLGLTPPNTAWHNSRDRSAEFISVLAILCGGLARTANEIYQLAKYEVNELAEAFQEGQVGSSTMPHKINPETCEQVVVLARLVKANTVLGFESLINEHERDYRAVRLEWVSVTESSIFACNCLALTKTILQGLVVNKNQIEKNLARAAEGITTEALMFKLGEKVGKQTAHTLIYQASITAKQSDLSLLEVLMSNPQISSKFSMEQLRQIVSPADQTGMAGQLVDNIIKIAKKEFKNNELYQEKPCSLRGICHS